MNCNECPYGKTREACIKLCKEAEEFVNQDYVGKSELTYSELGINVDKSYFNTENMYGSTTNEKYLIYVLYFLEGKTTSEINYQVSYSLRTIQQFIKDLRDNIYKFYRTSKQKQILDSHFLHNLPISDVALETSSDISYVRKVIHKYLLSIIV